MTKNLNCFGDGDGARSGVYKLNTYSGYIQANAWWQNPGQEEFLYPGSFTWTCPPGVSNVSCVCVGAGGGGNGSWADGAGGGGGLGWKNGISVIPGTTYTVQVGQGGTYGGSNNAGKGGMSYFISSSTVGGGGGGVQNVPAGQSRSADPMASGRNSNSGGGWTGDGGGQGGIAGGSSGSGGGAGGYSANGGNEGTDGNAAGGSASGGGQYSSTYGYSAGGGTGVYGRRTDYTPTRFMHGHGASNTPNDRGLRHGQTYAGTTGGGQGGSNRTGIISGEETGWGGCPGENPWGSNAGSGTWSCNPGGNLQGGFPGGGAGGPGTSGGYGGGRGGDGAVRIIWAGETAYTNRSFPDTYTEDIQ